MKTSVLLFFYVCLCLVTQAQTHTWTGNGLDNSWFTSANWDAGTTPSASSDVLIPNASTVEIDTAIATVNSLELSGNSTLQLENDLILLSQLLVPSGSNIDWYTGEISGGGTIENNGEIQMETFNEKKITNITLNNNGAIYITETNLNRASNGAVINNNETGLIEIDSVGGWTQLEPGCTLNNSGRISKVNDGNNFSTFYLIFDINNSGIIHAGLNQTFLMLGGTMTLNNMENGIISGTGIFDITATFENNGTFSPGGTLGPGTMEVVNVFSFPPSSTLELDIDGRNTGEYDVAAIFGFPVLEGSIVVNLHYAPQIGDEFEVLTANNITTCNLADSTTAVYDGIEYMFEIECNATNITLRVTESTLELSDFTSENYEFYIYPNPVNETININFNASEAIDFSSENISLTVYNTLGQRIRTFADFSEDKRSFKRGNLNAGFYFLQLSSDSKILATTKMIVI